MDDLAAQLANITTHLLPLEESHPRPIGELASQHVHHKPARVEFVRFFGVDPEVNENEGETSVVEPLITDEALAEELQCLEVQEHSSISYHALAGGHSPHTLRFTGHVNGSPGISYLWQGESPTGVQPVQLHSLRHLTAIDAISSFFCLELVHEDMVTSENTPVELKEILNSFEDVFQKPLPPERSQDHAIHLQPGISPVNVKPYHYPYFQKHVMQQLVTEMLKECIIRPSNSPFFSPMLLVRKKDGTWRFCVDYRALNALTVRDRFLIPMINEIFDELHETRYFSKLDLLLGYHQIRVQYVFKQEILGNNI
uniref:Uncharacterized protein LOC104237120 n=1 Tax=Nicotiana sylvestris TaxID=4096 RepID=A0A1U7XBP9_NICSY|nr:PREDICTED: uncharacterized protein LOC104237120 [Nicotiana sylvestris]